MALSNEDIREYSRRLLLSRMRILCNHGFFGLLLMHMRFSVDENVETACTDGEFITFGTGFLSLLSDSELDFVMMHEIMHVALRHCLRGTDLDPRLFNIACDIVVNSNILLENGMNEKCITLRAFGDEASMHTAPDGKEGHIYTAEEVYAMLAKDQKKQEKQGTGKGKGNARSNNGKSGGSGQDQNDSQSDGGQGGGQSQSNQANAQSNSNQDQSSPRQQSSQGGAGQSDDRSDTQARPSQGGAGQSDDRKDANVGWDDHSRWGCNADDREMKEVWEKRIADAAEAIAARVAVSGVGKVPLLAERLLKELRTPQSDWRSILADFVQEDITDYSFSPPDRRLSDSPFFLPDFNEKEERLDNILFMIDTSGSMSDDMITAAYSEILGAIEQFDGKLSGYLGFFDAAITEPTPFTSLEEFRVIRPKGGGGTSFMPIFTYATKQAEKPPASIIILTDGYAPYPDESATGGIPVLWLLVNEDVTPPFGRIARIKV